MLALTVAAGVMSAATASQAYGDSLLASELRRHPQLKYAKVILENPVKGEFQVGNRPARGSQIVLPLANALGNQIGTVVFAMARRSKKSDAAKIASDISRHIYSASGLTEADPFVPGAVRSAKAQQLIERELKREPSLVTIAFHVALPGRENQIIASNFGRIGKLADADDRRVIATSTVLQEVTNGGKRFAVELPMLDRSGRTIGALSTSFSSTPGGQQDAYQSALRVRQDLARWIPQLDSLAG